MLESDNTPGLIIDVQGLINDSLASLDLSNVFRQPDGTLKDVKMEQSFEH